jgi:hypothetical protein
MNRALSASLLVTLLTATTAVPLAEARGVSASAGMPSVRNDQCFVGSSYILQNCGGSDWFTIPLPVDNMGWKSVTVNVTGDPATNQIGCQAAAYDQNGYPVSTSPTVYLGTRGTQNIYLPSIYVPAAGTVSVSCRMWTSSMINTVNWNE